MLARLGSTAFLAAVLVACGSIPELTFVEDDGGVIVPPSEGGPPAEAGCTNCNEVCDDGIDNDGDGKIDCQDSDCQPTYSCQDAPADWTVVGFAAATRPSCPAGAPSTDLQVSAGDGTTTCNCNCTSVGGSCTSGSYTLTLTTENTCAVAPATRSIPLSGNCAALATPFNVPAGAFVEFTRPAGPASCMGNATVNGSISSGRMCQSQRFGKGCNNGQVCAPKPSTGASSCVTKLGANACPAGYGKKSLAGTAANDQRTCEGCVCGNPTACSGGSVSVYDGAMCKTTGSNKGATGIGTSCASATDSGFTASHFTASPPTGGCATTPTTQATPGPGALSFANERTVCCR